MRYAVDPRSIALDPRFWSDGSALFDELAVEYGQDAVGLAWVAALLFVREQRNPN